MSGQKSEEPTPKKLREARRRGEVAKSREVHVACSLLGAWALLAFGLPPLVRSAKESVSLSFAAIASPPREAALPAELLKRIFEGAIAALAPLLLALFLLHALAGSLQSGALFSPRAASPRWSRLDPWKGLRRLFGSAQLIELAKGLLLLLIVFALASSLFWRRLPQLATLPRWPLTRALAQVSELFVALTLRVALLACVVATLDLLYQRWKFRRDRRMSRDEVRREHRESEGDPHTKQARERLHRELTEHAVFEEVRRADVLVVNPTHLAVALVYRESEGHQAPRVSAKGQDALAQRMIEVAREAGVPVVRDVALGRTLYELAEGEEIPELLYESVAALLKAAWQERYGEDKAPDRDDLP